MNFLHNFLGCWLVGSRLQHLESGPQQRQPSMAPRLAIHSCSRVVRVFSYLVSFTCVLSLLLFLLPHSFVITNRRRFVKGGSTVPDLLQIPLVLGRSLVDLVKLVLATGWPALGLGPLSQVSTVGALAQVLLAIVLEPSSNSFTHHFCIYKSVVITNLI